MEELKVKVGDTLLCIVHHYSGNKERFVTVTKVMPTGRIRVLELDAQFDKYGKQMGRGTSRASAFDAWAELSVPTPEDYKRIEKKTTIAKAKAALERAVKSKLSYEKAIEILKVLEVDA